MEMQPSTQEQALRLTRVLELIERNRRLVDAYKAQAPDDQLSINQYTALHDSYLAELEELMKPYGVTVHYSATA
ncbi:hypothetical protein ACAW87_25025 [Fibrella sp. GW2-5]